MRMLDPGSDLFAVMAASKMAVNGDNSPAVAGRSFQSIERMSPA